MVWQRHPPGGCRGPHAGTGGGRGRLDLRGSDPHAGGEDHRARTAQKRHREGIPHPLPGIAARRTGPKGQDRRQQPDEGADDGVDPGLRRGNFPDGGRRDHPLHGGEAQGTPHDGPRRNLAPSIVPGLRRRHLQGQADHDQEGRPPGLRLPGKQRAGTRGHQQHLSRPRSLYSGRRPYVSVVRRHPAVPGGRF